MTISSEVNYISYAGTGGQVIFPYPFKVFSASDLKVYLRSVGPVDVLQTLNVHYTVSGVGYETGGNVTMVTAPAIDQTLIIFRDPPFLQAQEYIEGGELPAVTHEDSLDKVVMQVQALSARSVKTPESGGQLDVSLPAPAASPDGLYLRWNPAGTALESVASEPVVTTGFPLDMINATDYGDGTVSYATLAAAVAAIGAEKRRLYLCRGVWPVSANLNIGANISCVHEREAILKPANGITLDIDGPIEAGDWQIYDWTGTGAINISGSPTAKVPLIWYGAVAGAGVDNAAVLAKVCESIGPNQTIWLSQGEWRVATALSIGAGITYNLKIHGDGWEKSRLYINTPGSVGITFGAAETSRYGLEFKNFSVVGPAGACTDAINIKQWHDVRIEDVNLFVGASLYALRIEGCVFVKTRNLRFQQKATDWGGYTLQANGIYVGNLELIGSDYAANVIDLHVLMTGTLGMAHGIYCESRNFGVADADDNVVTNYSHPIKISGTLQNCSGYPIYISRFINVDLTDLYATDNCNNYTAYLHKCINVKMNNLHGATNAAETVLDGCYNAVLMASHFGKLTIRPNCRGVKIVACEVYTKSGLVDLAPDTVILGVHSRSTGKYGAPFPGKFSDRRNLLNNALFNRWQSATQPDSWGALSAAGIWTQCGVGLADTEARAVDYCAKVQTNGATTQGYYTLGAAALKQVKGKFVNYTVWSKLAAGQTFTDFAHHYLTLDAPVWAALTAYEVGQGVKAVAGFGTGAGQSPYVMVCIVGGTTGAVEPTWTVVTSPTKAMTTVTDGTVTWLVLPYSVSETNHHSGSAADIGVWLRNTAGLYVPNNAVSLALMVRLARQSVGAPDEGTMYISEPFLGVGWEGPDSVIPGQDEHIENLFLGGLRITTGTAMPATGFFRQGDIVLNRSAAKDANNMSILGWLRLVTGTAHVSGTDWAIMYVSHVSPAT